MNRSYSCSAGHLPGARGFLHCTADRKWGKWFESDPYGSVPEGCTGLLWGLVISGVSMAMPRMAMLKSSLDIWLQGNRQLCSGTGVDLGIAVCLPEVLARAQSIPSRANPGTDPRVSVGCRRRLCTCSFLPRHQAVFA